MQEIFVWLISSGFIRFVKFTKIDSKFFSIKRQILQFETKFEEFVEFVYIKH
jgi:hypothetical protein